MSNLIDRQQAIDALKGCYCGGEDSCGEPWIYEDHAIKAIEQLPSAQPDTYWKEQCQSYEQTINKLRESLSTQPEIILCKDCKHFEYDHVENVNGIPLIVAHEICMRWGDGVKTSENGYCFLAERREVTT